MKATALALSGMAMVASPFIGMTAAQAAPAAADTVYVSPTASSDASGNNCNHPAYRTIDSAVHAVARGGKVVVCGGTFHEQVTLDRPVTLEGRSNATIDAHDLINGVLITGPHVTVTGLTIKNAIGEGVLAQKTTDATIERNVVMSNNTGARLENPTPTDYPFCQAAGGGDCGENIHLEGTSHSVVQGNTASDGAGGILISDESGPASDNMILDNVVTDNHTACGIVLAGHNGKAAPGGKPARQAAGVFGNTVRGNTIFRNGLEGHGGAGVQMATAVAGGGVYDNTVTRNDIEGNGHSGVTVHQHVSDQYLNGNVVTRNVIGKNNSNGDTDFPAHDTKTTGVFVGSAGKLKITVSGNTIHNDHYGIFTAGKVTVDKERNNTFSGVTVSVSHNN